LSAFGVKSLAIFGSVAQGKAKPGSDLDMLVDFNALATFDQYMTLKFFLEDLFKCRVDLVTRKALKPRMRSHVEKEAILVA
jgi:predicted nucleotidyltransferase